MKFLDEIKMKFVKLPPQRKVLIKTYLLDKYINTYNKGVDSRESAKKRVLKACCLGEVVYAYDDIEIVKYFDSVYKLKRITNGYVLLDLYRDYGNKKYPIVNVSESVKDKYNREYGLTSHYQQREDSICVTAK